MIVRAAEIQAGMWNDKPASIRMNIHKDKWDAATKERVFTPENRNYYHEGDVEVLAVDPTRLDDPYLIQWPNGEATWVPAPDSRRLV